VKSIRLLPFVITVIGVISVWHFTTVDYKILKFPSLVKRKNQELPILFCGVNIHVLGYTHWLTGCKDRKPECLNIHLSSNLNYFQR